MSRLPTAAICQTPPPEPVRNCNRRKLDSLPAIYQVVVDCRSERDQEEIYHRLKAEGRKCRVLTL